MSYVLLQDLTPRSGILQPHLDKEFAHLFGLLDAFKHQFFGYNGARRVGKFTHFYVGWASFSCPPICNNRVGR